MAVLNHAFWLQQFGGDRSIIGRTIRLNQVPVTVVGVLGPGFAGQAPARPPQVFLPLATADLVMSGAGRRFSFAWDAPTLGVYFVVARLNAGIDRQRAERALQARYQVLFDEAIAAGARLSPKSLAGALPARRAARLDPAVTLRAE